MPTLLQCIDGLIENITVTDRQEENIKGSVSNLTACMKDPDNDLHVSEVFTNGSYERDTIIRPLKDIDLFAVLKRDKWADQYGNLPSPQSVLTKIKNYLNGLNDYKGKVTQNRPCVTIELSDKDFDVLPSFEQQGGGYLIPNHNLSSWIFSYPEQLTKNLDDIHKIRNYKVKPTIKAVKYWNREAGMLIPSYHIEEVAINIFQVSSFTNYEESIRLWFNNVEFHLQSNKFKSNDDYTAAINKIKKVKDKLNDAKRLYDEKKEDEAIAIWKAIFKDEFPTIDLEEAKAFGRDLAKGTLKVAASGALSTTVGNSSPSSKGFFGESK
ncbi:MAG: nucleotidyltransferase [Bacteroidia bacterium]|nr:nucleotidyltransferase [Bacteroidia bacterium]